MDGHEVSSAMDENVTVDVIGMNGNEVSMDTAVESELMS